jgi:hypothetical protein
MIEKIERGGTLDSERSFPKKFLQFVNFECQFLHVFAFFYLLTPFASN